MRVLVCFVINLMIFSDGVVYKGYKASLFVGWIAYFAILCLLIGRISEQIFVMGMQGLWGFMLHSASGMIVSLIYGSMREELLTVETTISLVLFFSLLRIEQEFFGKLLPVWSIFEEKGLSWWVSILPIAIFIGTAIPIAEVTFFKTWKERISRIFFPVFFFLVYRSLNIVTMKIKEKNITEQQTRLMSRQLENLAEQNETMERNRIEVTRMRENLLKNYIKLEKLLTEGKISEAKEFIGLQDKKLNSTRLKRYSQSALINAAVSIYFRRAEELGITISCKIDLPDEMSTDESDLAVLISNLLENAIEASKKQESPSHKEISLIIRNNAGKNILEVMNYCDTPIKLGENGLPYTTKLGRGLGMSSLEIFAQKYNAFYDFSQEDGKVQVNLYWNDHL